VGVKTLDPQSECVEGCVRMSMGNQRETVDVAGAGTVFPIHKPFLLPPAGY
jgi:hypothetical protein